MNVDYCIGNWHQYWSVILIKEVCKNQWGLGQEDLLSQLLDWSRLDLLKGIYVRRAFLKCIVQIYDWQLVSFHWHPYTPFLHLMGRMQYSLSCHWPLLMTFRHWKKYGSYSWNVKFVMDHLIRSTVNVCEIGHAGVFRFIDSTQSCLGGCGFSRVRSDRKREWEMVSHVILMASQCACLLSPLGLM